jgi:hypothetical protein
VMQREMEGRFGFSICFWQFFGNMVVFLKKIIFYVFKLFWYIDVKNNFLKIKIVIILIYFQAKNTLNYNHYHNSKHPKPQDIKLLLAKVDNAHNFPSNVIFVWSSYQSALNHYFTNGEHLLDFRIGSVRKCRWTRVFKKLIFFIKN